MRLLVVDGDQSKRNQRLFATLIYVQALKGHFRYSSEILFKLSRNTFAVCPLGFSVKRRTAATAAANNRLLNSNTRRTNKFLLENDR